MSTKRICDKITDKRTKKYPSTGVVLNTCLSMPLKTFHNHKTMLSSFFTTRISRFFTSLCLLETRDTTRVLTRSLQYSHCYVFDDMSYDSYPTTNMPFKIKLVTLVPHIQCAFKRKNSDRCTPLKCLNMKLQYNPNKIFFFSCSHNKKLL